MQGGAEQEGVSARVAEVVLRGMLPEIGKLGAVLLSLLEMVDQMVPTKLSVKDVGRDRGAWVTQLSVHKGRRGDHRHAALPENYPERGPF
jgi:hypothetical protein